MTDHILTEKKDRILWVTFNRPEKKNAITIRMYLDLISAFETAESDPDVRVLFITGTDRSFTAGNDLADFQKSPPTGEDSPVFRFLKILADFKKPLIAAVNGVAIGIGTTLLLHSDLVYAAQDAMFQLPFINLGICPEAASSYLLPRILGQRKAAELLMLGDPFTAESARSLGLVNEVFSPNELLEKSRQKAKIVAAKPPQALRTTKNLLRQGSLNQVQQAMREEGRFFVELVKGKESEEAFNAFFEKRKPDFSKF